MSEPNIRMVVISDIGDITNIHPTNKQDVGYRLAQCALAKTYGKTKRSVYIYEVSKSYGFSFGQEKKIKTCLASGRQ